MSIAAISSSFVAATRTIATPAPVDPAAATKGARHEGGRRHELVDAMNQALGQQVQDFLVKPVPSSVLVAHIRKMVRQTGSLERISIKKNNLVSPNTQPVPS